MTQEMKRERAQVDFRGCAHCDTSTPKPRRAVPIQPEQFMSPVKEAAWAALALDRYATLGPALRLRLAAEAVEVAALLTEKARELAPDGFVEGAAALARPERQTEAARTHAVPEVVRARKDVPERVLAGRVRALTGPHLRREEPAAEQRDRE